jgi:hypothetical protein
MLLLFCCCVLSLRAKYERPKTGKRQTIGRRDELVHLLHELRLPCPHNEGTSKPVHFALRRSRVLEVSSESSS